MTELKVLQTVRLKGRVSPADLAAILDEDPASIAAKIERLTESGLLVAGKSLKLSDDGRARLNELLARERSGIDTAAIASAYDDFRSVNADFKGLVTDWQVKNGEPNMHDDADYDATVLARLERVHQQVVPVITAAAAQIPRLAAYADKLGGALGKVESGDTTWLTRPIIDSYHTVWFELHEELIGAAGLTREGEAKAGHAQ
jgi:hypothetical protein